MKPKTIILLVVAVGCGLVASYMTSRLLSERESNQPEVEKEQLLIAKKDLPYGTQMKNPEELFELKEFPKDSVSRKALKSFDEIRNKRIFKAVGANSHITADHLMNKDIDPFVIMGKGMRAVSIAVDPRSGVAGFVQPGSHVDITLSVRKGDTDSYATTILQNILVMAIDTSFNREEGTVAKAANTVTLALTPQDVNKLSLATSMGEMRLALRSPGDEMSVAGRKITMDDVTKGTGGIMKFPGDSEPASVQDGSPRLPTGTALLSPIPQNLPAPGGKEPALDAVLVPTHVMTIYNGVELTKAVFHEKDGQTEAEVKRSSLDRDPEPKPEKKPKEPEARPAEPREPSKPKPAARQSKA